MKITFLTLLTLLALMSCSNDELNADHLDEDQVSSVTEPDANYLAWRISDLSDSLSIIGEDGFMFLDSESMLGFYRELDNESVGEDLAMNLDQIVYIHSGEGSLEVAGTMVEVRDGQIVFAKAGSEVRLVNVITQIHMVGVGMKTGSGGSTLDHRTFSPEAIESLRNQSTNVWNPFIQHPNVTLGLYMLPLSQGGDGRLVHTWEELNIITSGSSRFKMDTDEIEVSKGSIVFVEEGNGHFFSSLSADIDILILWEQP